MTKNVNYVSHKKSKVKNNGKPQLPSASALVEGEIAVNYAENVETLSIKNESGDVVTFSSDNYYSEQKLGSGFTGSNSGVTVTDIVLETEAELGSLESRINEVEISSGVAPTTESVEIWVDTDATPNTIDVYSKTEVNSLLGLKTNVGHTHPISDINNLQINLDAKVNKIDFNVYSGTVGTQINGINTVLDNFTKINVLGSVDVNARGYGESTPTLALYAGNKDNFVNDVLSHFKLGWFDGNGRLIKECAPGRISAEKNGTSIPINGTIDGTDVDLMVYTDTELYVDRLTTTGLSVNGSTATTHNVMGIGLAYHAVGNTPAKRFEPFGFTPHCAKYSNSKGYSYYDGGNVQTSINSLTSSVNALNKGGGYMGLYYEFYEIWLMAMYLELGTLDFTSDELFGRGCTNVTPNLSNWYTDAYEGGSGCMYTGSTFGSFWSNTVSSYNFAEMLEAQRIMDGITKAGFANNIGGTKLYTWDGDDVVAVTDDTNPSTWDKSSGMTQDKKYFTVKNVRGCKGLADGVMTGIVNIYVKGTDRIRKYSHPVYRGVDLLSGFFTQLEGIHYVVTQDADHLGQNAPISELFYANSWKDVPTDTSVFTNANSIVNGSTDSGITPVLVSNYNRGGRFSTIGDGWAKTTNYTKSLFAHESVGASQHDYECGYIWWRGTSHSSPLGTNSNGQLTAVGQSANASVVGCNAADVYAGRTLNANRSVARSNVIYAGGFAHPQITV